jgi:hypothetical protein
MYETVICLSSADRRTYVHVFAFISLVEDWPLVGEPYQDTPLRESNTVYWSGIWETKSQLHD